MTILVPLRTIRYCQEFLWCNIQAFVYGKQIFNHSPEKKLEWRAGLRKMVKPVPGIRIVLSRVRREWYGNNLSVTWSGAMYIGCTRRTFESREGTRKIPKIFFSRKRELDL